MTIIFRHLCTQFVDKVSLHDNTTRCGAADLRYSACALKGYRRRLRFRRSAVSCADIRNIRSSLYTWISRIAINEPLEARDRERDLGKDLLCDVIGIARVTQDPIGYAVDPGSVALDELTNSCLVTCPQALNQVSLVGDRLVHRPFAGTRANTDAVRVRKRWRVHACKRLVNRRRAWS
jgi:hypothetical protein